MMKNLIILLVILPVFCFGQSVPGCYNYVASSPIRATSNSTISGVSIDCGGAATVGINIPAGVHDVHITKCKISNSTTSRGLIYIGSGCYNITIDTCFLQYGWRGINAVGATNNIHIWNNYFYNIIDPNVTATSSDGGGSSVQLNNCNGTSIQVLDNKSYHDVSGAGVGDQFSVFQCNGTAASPIRVCRNQALNGSNNPPSTGYAGAVGGDVGGSYQRLDSNIFVNVGAVGAQIQGGHDIEMSYNTVYLAQALYTSAAMAFGNYSGITSYNITMAYNNAHCIQPTGAVRNYWFDPSTAFQPVGWSTNTSTANLNANILPSPLLPSCAITTRAPNISFSPGSYTFSKGLAIFAFTPNNSGSAATYTATLPVGLTINPGTGTITGTPTTLTAPTNYSVTAVNTAGSSTATVTIGVVADATLSKMIISSGTVNPGFNGIGTNYTASVGNTITSVTLTPTANQASSTITVNGTKVNSGSASGAISLAVGANTITTVVTAQDGITTKTYILTVTRAAATGIALSALVPSNGTLTPAFNSGTTNYTVGLDNSVTSITLTPTVNPANATVTVNGNGVTSGSASGSISLTVGANMIPVVVTAQDGVTTKAYSVMVTRAAATDATLSSLGISSGTLSPVFDSGTSIYTASVDNPITAITLTPIVNQANATVMVNGTIVTPGNASDPINLAVGVNNITTVVTAQDGSTKKTYTITITRAIATDALLSSLILSNGTLAPVFDSSTSSYTASVDNTIASVTLTPTLIQGNAPIAINGNPVVSGSASDPVNLDVGDNLITIVVIAPDGTTTYTLKVTRAASTDAKLSSLIVSSGILTPSFDAGITSYTDSVENATTSITVTPTLNQANATVMVNGTTVNSGTTSGAINLAVGDNTITAVVTAQDGSTNKSYITTVTRAAATDTIAFNSLANATYGDPPITLSASSNNTDAGAKISYRSDNTSVVTVSGNMMTVVGAGTANITASQDATANFKTAPEVSQPVTVNKANLTITANDQSKLYRSAFTFSGTEFTATGLLKNDAVNTVTLSSNGADVIASAGPYPITASEARGVGLANYNIDYQAGTLTVGELTLTFAAISSKVYGAADFSPGATSNSTVTYTSSNTDVATIVSGNIHIAGAGTSIITSTTDTLSQNQTLTVTPAPLVITANNVNKTYGTTLTDDNSTTAFKASGLQNGDKIEGVAVAYGTGASANATVAIYTGSAIPSLATGSNFNPTNYSIAYTPGDIIVKPAELTITADNQSKAAGAANPALTVSYDGFVNHDTPANLANPPTVTTTATTNSLAGDYPIIASGAVDSNYNISYAQGTLTISGLALSFGPMPSKVYGAADFDPGAASSSVITYASSDTTVATIVAGNIHIVGAGSSTIVANDGINSISQLLTVAPATLYVTSDNQSKTYGLANPDLTVSYSGFVNNDSQASLTSLPIASTSATLLSSVGTYSIAASGAAIPNYNIIYNNGTFTITPASLVITAKNQSKTQGNINPPLTLSFSGFMNGETFTDLNTQPVVSTTAMDNSPIGIYPITVSGATDPNYAITYVQGTLMVNGIPLSFGPIPSQIYGASNFNPGATGSFPATYTSSNTTVATIASGNIHIVGAGSTVITANDGSTSLQQTLSVAPAALTITANDQSKAQGTANPALTVSYSGFVNGDTPASLDTQPTITTTALTNSPVGTYLIAATGATNPNYSISYVPGTMTITAANTLTFGAMPSKIYGNADFNAGATTTGGNITYTSSNSSVATIVSGNIHIVGVGTSTITANNGSRSLQQTLSVTRAALTITANNINKPYGATLTNTSGSTAFTSTGLAYGQTIGSVTMAYGTGAAATAILNTYTAAITPSVATGGTFTAANYTISYAKGNIVVGKAALTITANNQSKSQGSANPVLTVSYSGFVNGQTNTVLTTQPAITTTATTNSATGTYPITASGAVAANYNIGYVAGTLTVTGSFLTFNPIPSKIYGTANFSPGATGSGTITYTSSNTTVATIISGNIHIVGVGTSTITAKNSSRSIQQTLTVTRAALTITANTINKPYGATLTNTAGSTAFTSTGLAYGQTIGSVTMAYGNGATATSSLNTYTSSITPSTATGGTFTVANYNITYVKGNIIVVKAALTIKANNVTKTYGSAISGGSGSRAFTATGLQNGQTISTVTIAYGSGASISANAGSYAGSVTPSAATGGTFIAANYTITYTSGNITVNQAALKITANNQSKTQGKINPTLTVSYSGFVNGQNNNNLSTQPKVTTTATTSSPVGKYPITASGAFGTNYAITYVQGTLTINPVMVSGAAFSPDILADSDPDKLDVSPMEPVVKQAVSPNGDGINEVLMIENIENYPDNKVMLMNRSGALIYEMTGYDNVNKVFDGHSNITKAMQQPGTYFYMVEYKIRDAVKRKTGYFLIKY